MRTAAYEWLSQQTGENGAPAATAAQQSQLAEQVDDERLAREAETNASPPRREDADASVGEAGAGDTPVREEEAAPIAATNTPASEAPSMTDIDGPRALVQRKQGHILGDTLRQRDTFMPQIAPEMMLKTPWSERRGSPANARN